MTRSSCRKTTLCTTCACTFVFAFASPVFVQLYLCLYTFYCICTTCVCTVVFVFSPTVFAYCIDICINFVCAFVQLYLYLYHPCAMILTNLADVLENAPNQHHFANLDEFKAHRLVLELHVSILDHVCMYVCKRIFDHPMSIITQWLSDIFDFRRLTLTTIFANVDNLLTKELKLQSLPLTYKSNIHQFLPSISTNINQYQSISTNRCHQYQSISINIHQSLPATRRVPPLCPCAPNTVVDIETCDFYKILEWFITCKI